MMRNALADGRQRSDAVTRDAGDPVTEIVDAQQRVVRRYARYATLTWDLFQSGNFSPDPWIEAHSRLWYETGEDVATLFRAFTRI